MIAKSCGVDVKELPMPEIKCRQYLSSREKCNHILSAPVLSTPGITRRRLCTMYFLFMCSTPPRRLLWLHHAVRNLVGRWLSDLYATFPIKVSFRVAICFLMLCILNNFFLTISFVMCCSFISSIMMHSMCRMLRYRNASSLFGRGV